MSSCRIGAVSYLNTRPLVYGLERAGADWQIQFDLPGRLADHLAAGQLDVALIPSIEVFQNPAYTIVSDACIACRGPVWSVKLMSRCPPGEIATLALDEGSRTSVALVQILLQRQHGILPRLQALPIDRDWRTVDSDAVLIIGDRAMPGASREQFPVQVDLGQWWYQWTRMPFVFAMWTARPGIPPALLNQLGRVLSRARDEGLRQSASIAASSAADYGLTREQCLAYFNKFLYFRLGPEERAGLDRFRSLAAELGLAPDSRELQYHGC